MNLNDERKTTAENAAAEEEREEAAEKDGTILNDEETEQVSGGLGLRDRKQPEEGEIPLIDVSKLNLFV